MDYSIPDLVISAELIERIQFSVSSRNAEAKLSECAAHVFAAPYSDNPNDIKWEYVSSGVACLMRNRELSQNSRKYMWSMSMCLYNASYGVLVWKAKLLPNSEYTAVADNFHVFALGEVNVLIGLLFSSKDRACELHTTHLKWHQERMRDDGKKGFISSGAQSGNEPARFRKEMISKPCNFQHIQGTQAIDECMDIEKIKADIVAALFGLGTKAGRSEADVVERPQKRKKKKEPVRQRLTFKEIIVPQTQSIGSPNFVASPVDPGFSEAPLVVESYDSEPAPVMMMHHQDSQQALTPPLSAGSGAGGGGGRFNMDMSNGYQDTGGHQQQQDSSGNQDSVGYQDSGNVQQSAGGGPGPRGDSMVMMMQSYDSEPSKQLTGQNAGQQQRTNYVAESEPPPNYQNPASPDYQEYSYSIDPPRLDMNLEKEFSESVLFKSSLMTAI